MPATPSSERTPFLSTVSKDTSEPKPALKPATAYLEDLRVAVSDDLVTCDQTLSMAASELRRAQSEHKACSIRVVVDSEAHGFMHRHRIKPEHSLSSSCTASGTPHLCLTRSESKMGYETPLIADWPEPVDRPPCAQTLPLLLTTNLLYAPICDQRRGGGAQRIKCMGNARGASGGSTRALGLTRSIQFPRY